MNKLLYLIAFLSITAFQCEEDCTLPQFVSDLDLTNSIVGRYNVGDTLKIDKFIDSNFELNSGSMLDCSDCEVVLEVLLFKFKEDYTAMDTGYHHFTDVSIKGTLSLPMVFQDDVTRIYTYFCNTNDCSPGLNLTIHTPGLYGVHIGSATFWSPSNPTCDRNQLNVQLWTETNNFEDLTDSPYPRIWIDQARARITLDNPETRESVYFFEVK